MEHEDFSCSALVLGEGIPFRIRTFSGELRLGSMPACAVGLGAPASQEVLKGSLILQTGNGVSGKHQKVGLVSERKGEKDAGNKFGQLYNFAKTETYMISFSSRPMLPSCSQ